MSLARLNHGPPAAGAASLLVRCELQCTTERVRTHDPAMMYSGAGGEANYDSMGELADCASGTGGRGRADGRRGMEQWRSSSVVGKWIPDDPGGRI